MKRRAWRTAIAAVLLLGALGASRAVHAQQPLFDSAQRCLGLRFVVDSDAPYCVLIPERTRSATDMVAIARKLNHLKTNVLLVDQKYPFVDPRATSDELLEALLGVLSALKKVTDSPIVLLGEERGAAVAIMAATHDFRIKGVIAASPGEYFPDRNLLRGYVVRLHAPLLVLYAAEEKQVVEELLAPIPAGVLVRSQTLAEPGFATLLGDGAESGAAWLAVSLFYNRLF